MRGQMQELVAAQLWDSAEILGGFLCGASAEGDSVPPADRAIHLVCPQMLRCPPRRRAPRDSRNEGLKCGG